MCIIRAVMERVFDRAANGSSEYLLSDPSDTSDYLSVQHFRHNAINPCLQTTYDFFGKVIDEVMAMHQVRDALLDSNEVVFVHKVHVPAYHFSDGHQH